MNNINGQIGQTPCGNIFMSAVYNGNLSDYNSKNNHYGKTSHRARIPGIHSYYLSNNNYNMTWLGANIDIKSGTVNNRSMINGTEIQITNYMHRYYRSLMVLNISLININGNNNSEFRLNHCNLNTTTDFDWKQWKTEENGYSIMLRQMTTIIPEKVNSTLISVGMAFQPIPMNITLSGNNPFVSFYGVLHNSLPLDTNISDVTNLTEYSQKELMNYITSYTPQEIYSSHLNAMESIWNTRVEFIGNDTITKGIYASYYNLINGIRPDYVFSISPGGIVTNDYSGHVFWDAETWMLPSLALIYPSTAAVMLNYRLNRVYAAQRFAKQNYPSFNGLCAQYVWESAFTGAPVCVIPTLETQEQHISADITRSIKIFYYSTKNVSWFFDTKSVAPYITSDADKIQYNYWNLSNQTCNFFSNRFVKVIINETYYYYTIYNVVPPDESAGVVNSSIYTNVAAALILNFCLNISNTFNGLYIPPNIVELWTDIVNHVYLPESNTLPGSNGELLHLEYGKYKGQDVNQADVALVQYPLNYFNDDIYGIFTPNDSKTNQLLMDDLIYYEYKTTNGKTAQFFTGDSSYSIAWLRLLNISMAQSFFNAAFNHMDTDHFYLFQETLTQNNGGHLNFLTGVGGLLQNTLYGYAGAHLTMNYLYFNPLLPLLSQSNITDIIFHTLIYQGIPFKFKFNKTMMSFQMKSRNEIPFDEYFVYPNLDDLTFYLDTLIPNYNTNSIQLNKTYSLTLKAPTITIETSLCRVYTK